MTMRPEDVDDLFGLPPLPPAPPPDTAADDALEAAEAALAAELASSIDADGVAGDAPDSRTDRRVTVSWPARMRLPGGRVIELQVRNISESGVGLSSDADIPADIVADFEMSVPPLGAGAATPVSGTIRTAYTVAQGSERLCGGTWQVPPEDLGLVNAWIGRLRG